MISVIGDGGWGTALAILLYNKGVETVLWSISREYAEYLDEKRENVKFLKGIDIPEGLQITSDDDRVKEAGSALFVVPCEYLRPIAERFRDARPCPAGHRS